MNTHDPDNRESVPVNVDIPIPEVAAVAGWKEITLRETIKSHEPLVPFGIFTDHNTILTSSIYAGEQWNSPYINGLEGSTMVLFAREGVADRLEAAKTVLPRGYHLMLMDAYRSLTVQAALYAQYEGPLRMQCPDWNDEQIATETQKYVSLPSNDSSRPSPHSTGASVDVVLIELPETIQKGIERLDTDLRTTPETNWQEQYRLEMARSSIIRKYGSMPNFGTKFDHGGPEAALRYYEELGARRTLTVAETEARSNRRILYYAMSTAGFMPYEDEWWHFNDPSSQMGAKVACRNYAEYGAATLSPENTEFEQIREMHHKNTVLLSHGARWNVPDELGEHYDLALQMAEGNNPRALGSVAASSAARISPSKR